MAVATGIDRISLVRSEGTPAIFVLLITRKALRECGPILVAASTKLGAFETPLDEELNPDKPISRFFRRMEELKLPWTWGTPVINDQKATAVCFVGKEICEEIAPKLTAAGCITNLK